MPLRFSDDSAWSFIADIFRREVPEIASGALEIRAVARIPGRRTIVALESRDPSVDPVRASLGEHNRRIASIVDRLGGHENVDVLPWSEDPQRLIRMALGLRASTQVTLDFATHTAVATVRPADRPRLDGLRGEDQRELASRLSGWNVALKVRDDAA